jgi:hypothetical protein
MGPKSSPTDSLGPFANLLVVHSKMDKQSRSLLENTALSAPPSRTRHLPSHAPSPIPASCRPARTHVYRGCWSTHVVLEDFTLEDG